MILSLGHVRGVNLDPQTRCEHYHGSTDIVAIKTKCCGVYYACKDCHAAMADHEIAVWPENEWNQEAILCGACGTTLTILQYMQSDSRCPAAGHRSILDVATIIIFTFKSHRLRATFKYGAQEEVIGEQEGEHNEPEDDPHRMGRL